MAIFWLLHSYTGYPIQCAVLTCPFLAHVAVSFTNNCPDPVVGVAFPFFLSSISRCRPVSHAAKRTTPTCTPERTTANREYVVVVSAPVNIFANRIQLRRSLPDAIALLSQREYFGRSTATTSSSSRWCEQCTTDPPPPSLSYSVL